MNIDLRPSQFLPLYLRVGGVGAEAGRAAAQVTVRREVYEDGEVIVPAGRPLHESCLLVRGMAVRRHAGPNGVEIISAICVPGDFMDLHSLLLKELDHEIVALGGTAVEFIDHRSVLRLCDEWPEIWRALWTATLFDAQAHRRWIVLAGALRAPQRVAHLMCELEHRLAKVGLADAGNFTMPLTQSDVARVTGHSSVHVNRVVQDLRADGLLEWRGRTVRLPDVARLRLYCGFDPSDVERTVPAAGGGA